MSSKPEDRTRVDRTSVPNSGRARDAFADETMAALGHGLVVGEVIGEGGMAVIHRGEQQSLRREVAIKIVAPEERASLLREAYVTALLEHPNIVPIHELVFDDDRRPMLVLKRIEGESWLHQMDEESRLEPGDGPDFVEWNVRIGIRISRALSFAHTRGIVHLDVKPSNVMVGPFGEVYLLDWGLAGSFDPNEHFLPSVPDGQRAGTPGYMAPEQWKGSAVEIGPWTDVYLLAASLYHALSGSPPWLRSGKKGRREAPSGKRPLPPVLKEILERAMTTLPGERIASAGAFRQELETYLRQRGSIQLVQRATDLSRDAVLLRANGTHDAAEYAAVEAAATFNAALSQWPENEQAMRGSLRLARSRIDDALARDQPQVAARVLAALDSPPVDLRHQVQQAVALAAHDASKVRALQHDVDRGVAGHIRVLFVALCGPMWVAGWLIGALSESMVVALFLLVGGTVGFAISVPLVGREMLSNRVNRMMVIDVLCSLIALSGVTLAGYVRGDTLLSLAPFYLVVHAATVAMVGTVFDARLSLLAIVWVVLFPLSLIWPNAGLWLLVAGNALLATGVMWVVLRLRKSGLTNDPRSSTQV